MCVCGAGECRFVLFSPLLPLILRIVSLWSAAGNFELGLLEAWDIFVRGQEARHITVKVGKQAEREREGSREEDRGV